MKIYAATLLFLFQFKLWDELRPVKHRAMLTLQIDGGLYVSAMDRRTKNQSNSALSTSA